MQHTLARRILRAAPYKVRLCSTHEHRQAQHKRMQPLGWPVAALALAVQHLSAAVRPPRAGRRGVLRTRRALLLPPGCELSLRLCRAGRFLLPLLRSTFQPGREEAPPRHATELLVDNGLQWDGLSIAGSHEASDRHGGTPRQARRTGAGSGTRVSSHDEGASGRARGQGSVEAETRHNASIGAAHDSAGGARLLGLRSARCALHV